MVTGQSKAYQDNYDATVATLAAMPWRDRDRALHLLGTLGGPYSASGSYEFATICDMLADRGIPIASGIFPADRAEIVQHFNHSVRKAV